MKRVAPMLVAIAATLTLAAPAGAAPTLNLDVHHGQSNAVPGGTPGSVSVRTATNGSAGASEVQEFTVLATTGTFRLNFGAEQTAQLPYDADAAAIEAALRALPSIGPTGVSVRDISQSGTIVSKLTRQVDFGGGSLDRTDVTQLVGSDGTPRLGIGPDLWFDVENVGDVATSGPITLTVTLPSGLTRRLVRRAEDPLHERVNWSCPGTVGDATITCTTTDAIPRYSGSNALAITLDVDSGLPAGIDRFVKATVSGGGSTVASPPVFERVHVGAGPASFGILPETFTPDFLEADGLTTMREAATHPELMRVPFDFTTIAEPRKESRLQKGVPETIRDLVVDLPPGFVGNPTAVDECSAALLATTQCPGSSQIGMIQIKVSFAHGSTTPDNSITNAFRPVYNMVSPHGTLTDLGFSLFANPIHIKASLDPARGYAIRTTVSDINETVPVYHQKLFLWGTPADPSHDSLRCYDNFSSTARDTSKECESDLEPKPFLTLPASCGEELSMRLHLYDSWDQPGVYGPDIDYTLPGEITDCDQVPFEPSVSIAPSTDAADSASGLDVAIEVPQDTDPEIATSPLKDATVTLPEGLTVNPASANGLGACAPAQIGLGTDDPVTCPNSAKVASVKLTTPLLPDPVEGVVYLATPHENPFDTLLAGYIVLDDPDRGLLVKIPGKITADPNTGQLSGIFNDNPQLPFSKFELHFQGGAYSTLITPKTCGDYAANAELAPWSGNAAAKPTSSFTIAKGANGGGCAGSEAELPNSPSFDAGPVSPVSGNYSPFVLHLRRQDGTQRFGAFGVTLPQGLTGKLAGTELCPDGALAGAESKSGREEQSSPSCPAASHVGSVHAAAGAGPSPYNVGGEAYLSGPYKGAPVSLAVITPAVAGPFDLGTIVIRTPLQIDPKTAQITALSDPIPQMLEGIPTDIRSIDVVMDRPEFTLTGTSCDPASIDGLLTSTLAQTVPLSVRYQLSDCGRLPFKPKTTLRLRGKTKRGGHPALTVVLRTRPGDANIASLQLAMPRSEFLENDHIRTICTRVQFAADACPKGAVYGKAAVTTPLLDYPLRGNVYLRSSDNVLPDLVPDLRGPAWQPVKVESAGRTDSIRGGIRNTFSFVPDAPFTRLVTKLPGGKKGLLVNSRDICARTYRATVRYAAHNGATYTERPKLRVKCKGKGRRKKHRRHRRKGKGGAKHRIELRRLRTVER